MLYRVRLEKDVYWGDEDEIGSCVFPAEDDENARQIITTLVTRMNRQYWRMGEPRFVRIGKLTNIDTQTADERDLCIAWMVPLSGLARIRHCLEFFYPKVENSRAPRRANVSVLQHLEGSSVSNQGMNERRLTRPPPCTSMGALSFTYETSHVLF